MQLHLLRLCLVALFLWLHHRTWVLFLPIQPLPQLLTRRHLLLLPQRIMLLTTQHQLRSARLQLQSLTHRRLLRLLLLTWPYQQLLPLTWSHQQLLLLTWPHQQLHRQPILMQLHQLRPCLIALFLWLHLPIWLLLLLIQPLPLLLTHHHLLLLPQLTMPLPTQHQLRFKKLPLQLLSRRQLLLPLLLTWLLLTTLRPTHLQLQLLTGLRTT